MRVEDPGSLSGPQPPPGQPPLPADQPPTGHHDVAGDVGGEVVGDVASGGLGCLGDMLSGCDCSGLSCVLVLGAAAATAGLVLYRSIDLSQRTREGD
ncbi:MAG TPA: hypothetical protein VG329_02350 [Candidatus Dormibacteraeota bacterium]|nr:hypothetical protein [Candidatus Dormibacteraeota bacterium]